MPRGFQRRTNPQYGWTTFSDIAIDAAIPAKLLGVTGNQPAEPKTLVRLRGLVWAVLNTAAVGEHVPVNFGITKVSSDAFGAGVGSVLGPRSDAVHDWIWRGQIFLSSLAEAAVATDFLAGSVVVDSKAMRKIKPSDTLIIVAETIAGDIAD